VDVTALAVRTARGHPRDAAIADREPGQRRLLDGCALQAVKGAALGVDAEQGQSARIAVEGVGDPDPDPLAGLIPADVDIGRGALDELQAVVGRGVGRPSDEFEPSLGRPPGAVLGVECDGPQPGDGVCTGWADRRAPRRALDGRLGAVGGIHGEGQRLGAGDRAGIARSTDEDTAVGP
jgi:hypothetical protein